MEDKELIELYLNRSPSAVEETERQYGKLIRHIAKNILGNEEDACECENDTYMALWNSIPPNVPDSLLAYACRVGRNVALKRFRDENRRKRSSMIVALEELEDLLPDPGKVEDTLLAMELGQMLNLFVGSLDRKKRLIFLYRYWYGDSSSVIANTMGMSKNAVNLQLFRIRGSLEKFLRKEGFYE